VASVQSAEAQITQAQASLDQSQVNLSHTIITAPVDGIVLSRNVEVGQTVAAGLQAPTLFVIARDLSTMQVYAAVDEADVGHVQVGQPVTFRVDAYGAERFTGKVREVRLQPVVTQNVVSYTTVIDVPNPAQKLKPGMTATVSIEVGRADAALRVPAAALRFRPASASGTHGQTVWVMNAGALRPVHVKALLSDGTMTAIADGALDEKAEVVTGMATSTTAQASPQSSSPLVPSFPRRGAGQSGGARRGN
jgi:HlyD family secretion protein